jgi:hypothetical protein
LKPGGGIVRVIDEVNGRAFEDLPIHEPIVQAAFATNGEALWIGTPHPRMHLVDPLSGKHLRVIDPYKNMPLLEFLTAVSFLTWVCFRVWAGAKLHRHAWLDCAVVTGLVIAYVLARSRLTGFSSDVMRPIY